MKNVREFIWPVIGLLAGSPAERLLRFVHARLALPGRGGEESDDEDRRETERDSHATGRQAEAARRFLSAGMISRAAL